MDDWEMARLGIRAVRTMARFAEQQQRARERELKQASKEQPAEPPARRPEFAMPVNADGEIPDEFLPRM
jgi:hypothetical protein